MNICAVTQEKDGPIFKLHVRSKISYHDFILWADEVTYDSNSGDAKLEGHVVVDGGPNDEHIEASQAEYNIRNQTGQFHNVVGTIGLQKPMRHMILTSTNPFAFTGKLVEKNGPDHYIVHDGTVTSCELPHPKWQFNAHRVVMELGRENGLQVGEPNLTRYDLFNADECFLTGTGAELIPVVKIDGRVIGSGTPGSVIARRSRISSSSFPLSKPFSTTSCRTVRFFATASLASFAASA